MLFYNVLRVFWYLHRVMPNALVHNKYANAHNVVHSNAGNGCNNANKGYNDIHDNNASNKDSMHASKQDNNYNTRVNAILHM